MRCGKLFILLQYIAVTLYVKLSAVYTSILEMNQKKKVRGKAVLEKVWYPNFVIDRRRFNH